MLIPLVARPKGPGKAQDVAPLLDEIIETIKRMGWGRESGCCHHAPPGSGGSVTCSQSPMTAERRCGDAGSTPQATFGSANYGTRHGLAMARGGRINIAQP